MDFIKLFFSIFKLAKKKLNFWIWLNQKNLILIFLFTKLLFEFLLKFGQLKIERRS